MSKSILKMIDQITKIEGISDFALSWDEEDGNWVAEATFIVDKCSKCDSGGADYKSALGVTAILAVSNFLDKLKKEE